MDRIRLNAAEGGGRIDQYLCAAIEGLSRSAAQKLIEDGFVTKDGQAVRKNYRVNSGDVFDLTLPSPAPSAAIPQDIPLAVVYEDSDVIVVNKPRGMVVHPAAGHPDGTLVNALLYHCRGSLSGIGGEIRPGIVHRIDKDTSGLIIAAKNDAAHASLSAQLKDHSLSRVYEAVVHGRVSNERGTISAPIGRHSSDRKRMSVSSKNSRDAVTHYETIARYKDFTHVRCILETGRTHQIRVHMAYSGHPLLGDLVYGHKKAEKGLSGQCLHARSLTFRHPESGETVTLNTALPKYFTDVLSRLGPEST